MSHAEPISTIPQSAPAEPRGPAPWRLINGLLLIALGAFFLILTPFFKAAYWWSSFIYIAAIGQLWAAALGWGLSRGAFNAWVRVNLASGLITLAVATIFALGLDWDYAWTFMLIGPGLIIFLNGFTFPRQRFGHPAGGFANLNFWIGASVALLGVTFLLNQLGLIHLQALYGNFHWWGLYILLPGLGAVINALAIYRARGPGFAAGSLLALGAMCGFNAAAIFLNWPWLWVLPATLILGGAVLLGDSLLPKKTTPA